MGAIFSVSLIKESKTLAVTPVSDWQLGVAKTAGNWVQNENYRQTLCYAHGWFTKKVTPGMGGEMSKQGSHARKCMQARWVMSVVLAMKQRPSAWMKGWLLFSAGPFVPCGNTGLLLPDVQTSQEKSETWIFMWVFLISKCVQLFTTDSDV